MATQNVEPILTPHAPEIVAALGLTMEDIPRFRDAAVIERDGALVVAVYTRNGSPTRGLKHWREPAPEDKSQCPCAGCRAETTLAGHPLYLDDQDDEHDATYATYHFWMPPNLDVPVSRISPSQAWNQTFQ